MPTIDFKGARIEAAPGETVLDAMLRSGIDAPHSCRAGFCRTCIARAVGGPPPAGSQDGLKDSWKAMGLFLTCRAVPQNDLNFVPAADLGLETRAVIEDVARLGADVVRVRVRPESPFEYRGGQFVSLIRGDGLARSYSTASIHGRDPWIELHVREVPNGAMSGWLAREAARGDAVSLRGPEGECFYVPGRAEQPMLLIGTGTGLAPLYAVAQDALAQGHAGRIAVFHGALEERGLYLVDEMRAIAAANANVNYMRCLVRGASAEGVEVGAIQDIVRAKLPSLRGWRVFLCGNPDLVFDLRKKAFLAGAAMKDIYADAFVMKTPPAR